MASVGRNCYRSERRRRRFRNTSSSTSRQALRCVSIRERAAGVWSLTAAQRMPGSSARGCLHGIHGVPKNGGRGCVNWPTHLALMTWQASNVNSDVSGLTSCARQVLFLRQMVGKTCLRSSGTNQCAYLLAVMHKLPSRESYSERLSNELDSKCRRSEEG